MHQKLGKEMLVDAHDMTERLAALREMRARGKKPKVGIFGITGCAGCQLTILFAQEKFLSLLNMVDILSVPFVKEQNHKGKFDIIILEGLVASKEDKARAEELRARCDVLMCIGACAVHGCVPAMKNFTSHPEVERAVYAKVGYLNSLDATPVSKHVPVDIELPGCPPDENQIYAVLTDLVLGRPPRITHNPVCVECVKREVDCLLLKGKPCLGPITTGGCDAICTAAGHECMGCRGPTEDANLTAFVNILGKHGHKKEDVEKRLHTYAGLLVEEQEKAQHIEGHVEGKSFTVKKSKFKPLMKNAAKSKTIKSTSPKSRKRKKALKSSKRPAKQKTTPKSRKKLKMSTAQSTKRMKRKR